MDVGLVLPTLGARDGSPADIVAAARHAEELGFESVWVVDQLIAGTGVPILDSLISLAAAAGATGRVRLGVGVLIVPLRPVAWVAKQVASLQHISGDRLLLGVGAGGDRHEASWAAAGVPRNERGRRTDEALRLLPDLISGRPVRLADEPSGPEIQLSPGATVPPIIVGGMSGAAMSRAARYGDGWFVLGPPDQVAQSRMRLQEISAGLGRPVPALTVNLMVAMHGDPDLPGRTAILGSLSDPDGLFGIPADAAGAAVIIDGPGAVAGRLAELAASGAGRVVVTIAAGDWFRQAGLLAEAAGLKGDPQA
jgi:alkanesulfonate monooxygenase SsuD/methylene tetrahydromethanopterin reductase-like flavin-dependent oxidoreductase (luciferase family)